MAAPMKEGLDADAISRIGQNLQRAHARFPREQFVEAASAGLETLELKQRVNHVIAALHATLPQPYPKALEVLLAAGAGWDRGPDSPLAGFAAWPLIDYVGAHGLQHFDDSMAALRVLTPLFSAEFAIRPFLAKDPGRAFPHLNSWVDDPDEHVRRLVSEGTRPRLPWGSRLTELQRDPAPILPLLERLHTDPADYVRRSVANHINDISKDHPETAVAICRRWSKGASKRTQELIRRALRGLEKAGHGPALELLGYPTAVQLKLLDFQLKPKRLELGETLSIAVTLRSTCEEAQALVVDYAVHHLKADGSLRPKVFKLKKLKLDGLARTQLQKQHAIRPISTRRYYPGKHRVELLVNGRSLGVRDFWLASG